MCAGQPGPRALTLHMVQMLYLIYKTHTHIYIEGEGACFRPMSLEQCFFLVANQWVKGGTTFTVCNELPHTACACTQGEAPEHAVLLKLLVR